MKQYLDLLRLIKERGVFKGDRTGTGTQSLFGAQIRCDLQEGFPLLTTKKMFTRGIIEELLWFLRGSTNVRELQERKVHIWDEWAEDDGYLGEIYGAQWRHWGGNPIYKNLDCEFPIRGYYAGGIDQIKDLIERIQQFPDDRRLIVSAWNVSDVPHMCLPCCHVLFQCWTRELTVHERIDLYHDDFGVHEDFVQTLVEGKVKIMDEAGIPRRGLSLQLYQRSCDVFLGVPFNIASYTILTHMLAQVCGMIPLEFVHTYGDVHIYNNHREQVDEQLSREPKPLPKLWINPEIIDIDGFRAEDIKIEGYECWPGIKAPVSV